MRKGSLRGILKLLVAREEQCRVVASDALAGLRAAESLEQSVISEIAALAARVREAFGDMDRLMAMSYAGYQARLELAQAAAYVAVVEAQDIVAKANEALAQSMRDRLDVEQRVKSTLLADARTTATREMRAQEELFRIRREQNMRSDVTAYEGGS